MENPFAPKYDHLAVLRFVDQSSAAFTVSEISEHFNISYDPARNILEKYVKAGVLAKTISGYKCYYASVEALKRFQEDVSLLKQIIQAIKKLLRR